MNRKIIYELVMKVFIEITAQERKHYGLGDIEVRFYGTNKVSRENTIFIVKVISVFESATNLSRLDEKRLMLNYIALQL